MRRFVCLYFTKLEFAYEEKTHKETNTHTKKKVKKKVDTQEGKTSRVSTAQQLLALNFSLCPPPSR